VPSCHWHFTVAWDAPSWYIEKLKHQKLLENALCPQETINAVDPTVTGWLEKGFAAIRRLPETVASVRCAKALHFPAVGRER